MDKYVVLPTPETSGRVTLMGMRGKLAPVLGVVASLGIVGGVVGGSLLSHPASKPAVVHVQPADATVTPTDTATTDTATVTPSPTTTTVAPAPVQSTSAAPAPVAPQTSQAAPVSSSTSSAPQPAAPAPAAPAPATTQAPATPGQPIHVDPGNAPTGAFGPGQTPSTTKTP